MIGTSLPPLALPKSGALTDAVLAPSHPGPSFDERVAIRTRVIESIGAIVAGSPRRGPITLDAFRLRRSQLDPTAVDAREPFAWSARRARRLLGLRAARSYVEGRHRTLLEGVTSAIDEGIARARSGQDRRGSLGYWLATLPAGARALVSAEALTWSTHVYESLQWERFAPAAVIGPPDRWWDCPGGSFVTLKARSDVFAMSVPGSVDETPGLQTLSEDLFVPGPRRVHVAVLPGRPSTTYRIELGLSALVDVVAHPSHPAPARVVGWWPQSGRAYILGIDRRNLDLTANAVVQAVDLLCPRAPGRSRAAA